MASQPSPFEGIERMVERMNQQLENLTRSFETEEEDSSSTGHSDRQSASIWPTHGEEFIVTRRRPGLRAGGHRTHADRLLARRSVADASRPSRMPMISSFIRRERRRSVLPSASPSPGGRRRRRCRGNGQQWRPDRSAQ
ncbi:MAG: hypothetical protein U5K37_02680 [Natrialbaceae archaeon]|nr:hypothetical protein [Natrialbaceae archaeon]